VMLYGVNLGLRYLGAEQDAYRDWLPIALSFICVGLLSFSGYLGGTMVFDDGIGVGRHRRRTRTPEETIHASGPAEAVVPGQPAWVPVPEASRLREGETLRVEAQDHVFVLAKYEARFYAFQEFCTHRYGPLSEGALGKGIIECPWHRSCFDIKNGKVTKGPAKMDLQTYPVELREGSVFVQVPGREKPKSGPAKTTTAASVKEFSKPRQEHHHSN
jgi:nitrite reductase/ring-hydroxylating ferredoxin subunit